MTKATIRTLMAERKKNVHGFETASAQIVQRIQTLDVFQSARTVGVYMPLADEVDLRALFHCLEKRFYIPAFDKNSATYRMAQRTSALEIGRFGILEPANPVFAAADELDLILVPGVAFDPAGHRIGRGGGFYDRLLTYYDAVPVGVGFDFQWLDSLPTEKHDISMRWGVTETRLIEIPTNS